LIAITDCPARRDRWVRIARAACVALSVGVAFGVVGERLLGGNDDTTPALRGDGMLTGLPGAPVTVRAETVLLPSGLKADYVLPRENLKIAIALSGSVPRRLSS
jgi:hypothetical protein